MFLLSERVVLQKVSHPLGSERIRLCPMSHSTCVAATAAAAWLGQNRSAVRSGGCV